MTPLELFANSPTPGAIAPIATLALAITTTPAPGTLESYPVSGPAPPDLRSVTGQYRVMIDGEIMIVAASASGASPWSFKRGQEGTASVVHELGAAIYHVPTAGAIRSLQAYADSVGATAQALTTAEQARAVAAEVALSLADGGTFVFSQLAPSTMWEIAHGLGGYPPVFTVDSAGSPMIGDVSYPDSNNVVVTFGTPEGGTAYLAK